MPPKAKRSTKKKKKKKGSKKKAPATVEVAGTASTPSHDTTNNSINVTANVENNISIDLLNAVNENNMEQIYRLLKEIDVHHVVNENDDLERIGLWLKRDHPKIDTKRMKKYMPATVNDLRSGNCSPIALGTILANWRKNQANLTKNETSFDDKKPSIFQQLVERVLSSLPDHDLDCEEYDEIASEMEEDFYRHSLTELRRLGALDGPELNMNDVAVKALDCLCKSWARRFDDRFYEGAKGSFLQNCAVYHEDLRTLMLSVTPMGEHELNYALQRAATLVAKGIDREEDTCWQCGSIRTDMESCSKCRVACFCGNECMKVAWSSWHRVFCRQIRDEYKRYRDSMKAVEDAHVSNT